MEIGVIEMRAYARTHGTRTVLPYRIKIMSFFRGGRDTIQYGTVRHGMVRNGVIRVLRGTVVRYCVIWYMTRCYSV